MPILFIFLFISAAYAGEELCFNSYLKAATHATVLQARGLYLMQALNQQGRKTGLIKTFANPCTGCVSLEGDSYLVGVFKEEFEENIKPELPVPLKEEIQGMDVDVSISRLVPDEIINGERVFNHHYRPFLRFPGKTSNTFYDYEKNPIETSARIVHPELIEYTFKSKGKEHVLILPIGEKVSCIFPVQKDEINVYKKQLYMKEGERFLPLKGLGMSSLIRNFIPPEGQ